MSLIPIGVTVAQAAIQSLLQPVFLRTRSIGPFVANVTVEELHTDELRITDHPVERNAVVSDHAFKLPMRVRIIVGYSNSSPQSGGDPNYVNDVYAQFLALQESRELITILTGKRLYENMLIERLAVTTDEKTENALMMACDCREIILVDTQVTATAPAQDQSTPQDTAPVQNQGAVATQSAPHLNINALDATLGSDGTFNSAATTEVPIAYQSQTQSLPQSPYSLSQALP
jgi:hypothetical protein